MAEGRRAVTRGRLLALTLLLAGPAFGQVKNADTYTYLTVREVDSLDPAWANDAGSRLVQLNVYEPLFAFEGSSTEKIVPLAASKVPSRANGLISADGLTYRIPIRKGARFHDGSLMTAEDARYSLLRFMLQDRAGGPSTFLLQPLLGEPSTRAAGGKLDVNAYEEAAKAVQVQGDELVVRLKRPFAPLLKILTMWCPVVSKAWAAKNGEWDGSAGTWAKFNNPQKESSAFFERANGTGPFKLERWDRRNRQLVLARHDGYWRKPAQLARVVIKTVTEFGTRKLMLLAGDADSIYSQGPVLSQLRGLAGVRVRDDLPAMGMDPVLYFTFKANPAANPYIGSGKLDGQGIPPDFFSDKDARTAIAHSFDYAAFLRDVNHGKGYRDTGCIPKGLLGHNDAQKTRDFDLAKAKEHFQKALGGKAWATGFRFTLAYNSGNVEREIIGQILKRNIESLNPKFSIDVRPIEWPTYLDALNASKIPLFVTGLGVDYPDPHDFAYLMMHSQGDMPALQKFKDDRADKLVDAALAEQDEAKRKALYAKLQQVEFEDVPHVLLVTSVNVRADREWVQGWTYNPLFPQSASAGYFYPIYKAARPASPSR
jgi:peptide/nickel transport system substrate-binding protein